MIKHTPEADTFKEQLRNSLERETKDSCALKFTKHANIYTCGDKSEHVYFIESGQVKIVMLSREGKRSLLAIHADGDVFGELCLSTVGEHQATATAMKAISLKQIPCSKFFLRLAKDSLLEGFIRYLVVRIADQEDIINNLVTVDSEQRLGKTLLRLARKIGHQDPRSIRLKQKITHEELSEMVGTTRPRISKFMHRFVKLNLIGMSPDHFILVKEKNLTDYLDQLT